MTRRRLVQRLTSAAVGATIATFAGIAIAALSGANLDVELVFIIGLAAMGGWLLLTAALTPTRRGASPDVYSTPAPVGAPASIDSDED